MRRIAYSSVGFDWPSHWYALMNIKQLIDSGKVQLNDRRAAPRFRFTGPIEIVAVDVVGAIVPTEIHGHVSEISSSGCIIAIPKKLTCKGLFVRFAEDDALVMPASVARVIRSERDEHVYALKFAAEFENHQLLRAMSYEASIAKTASV